MVKRLIYFSLVLFTLVLSSCSKKGYMNSLPKESQLVMSIQAEALLQKSGIKDFSSLPAALQKIMSEPQKVGIDWAKPLYAFISENTMGAVASISDSDKLTDYLKENSAELGINLDSDGDYNWATTDMLLIGYNDEQLLAMTIYGDSKVFRQRAKKLMEQDAAESFAGTASFQKLLTAGGDMAVFTDATVIPESIISSWLSFLPKDVSLANLSALFSADFQEGKVVAKAEIFSEEERIQQMIQQLGDVLKPQTGTFNATVPADFTYFASFHGTPQLMEMLKKNRDIGMTLALIEQVAPIEDLLQSIDGDVMVYSRGASDIQVYAPLSDTKIFTDDSWAHQNGIRSLENHVYGFENYTFGLTDKGDFFLSYSPVSSIGEDVAFDLSSWTDSMKNSLGFALVNCSRIKELSVLPASLRSQLDIVTARWYEPTKLDVTLSVKNQQENILKTLLESWTR